MIPNGNIILKPKSPTLSAIDVEFEKLQFDLLALAARWTGVNIRGLPPDVARRVVQAEADRLRAVAAMMEAGI